MTVFIGWSGEISKEIASVLKNWLSGMFDDHINIFTPNNFAGESLWSDTVDEAISSADFGLLCVTADNVNSQWLTYEAGALSRNVKSLVPLLFGVSALRLGAPLRMFQSVPFGVDGMRELTAQLNQLCGDNRLSAQELEQRFQARYPTLEAVVNEKLSEIKSQVPSALDNGELTFGELLSRITKALERLEAETSPATPPRVSP